MGYMEEEIKCRHCGCTGVKGHITRDHNPMPGDNDIVGIHLFCTKCERSLYYEVGTNPDGGSLMVDTECELGEVS